MHILWDKLYIDGLVQDCSDSIANTLEVLHSCTKPSICDSLLGHWRRRAACVGQCHGGRWRGLLRLSWWWLHRTGSQDPRTHMWWTKRSATGRGVILLYIDGLVQDCCNSNVLAMALLHPCTIINPVLFIWLWCLPSGTMWLSTVVVYVISSLIYSFIF